MRQLVAVRTKLRAQVFPDDEDYVGELRRSCGAVINARLNHQGCKYSDDDRSRCDSSIHEISLLEISLLSLLLSVKHRRSKHSHKTGKWKTEIYPIRNRLPFSSLYFTSFFLSTSEAIDPSERRFGHIPSTSP